MNLKVCKTKGKRGKNVRKKAKKELGITLIGLVVTIIVLLILAGVSISVLVGNNGVINKAKQAATKWEEGKINEQIELTKLELLVEKENLKEGELLDDEKHPELQPFITEWTVESGESITLPLCNHVYMNKYNCTVDYGDGTEIKEITDGEDEDRIHTYENAGTYVVTITGQCPVFSFSLTNTSKDKITKIVQWGAVFKGALWNCVDFNSCINLKGEIPSPTKNTFANISDRYSGLFANCKSLSGKIPANLFTNATPYVIPNAFHGCTGLTGTIPECLFANCVDATSFREIFSGCTGLVGGIPENLFTNCTSAEDFYGTFSGCTGLTGSIPENLFKNCTEITDLSFTFEHCSGIDKIPNGLLHNSPKITTVHAAFGNTGITEIPADLFDINNGQSNGIEGMAGAFKGTKIKEIPAGLFDLCTEVTHFGNWASNYGIFSYCELLKEIPKGLFKNNTKVQDFHMAFGGCSGITEIPADLFATCNQATQFTSVFWACGEILSVAEGFSIPESALNVSEMFNGCGKLKSIPSSFVLPIGVSNVSLMFQNCGGLETLPTNFIIPQSVEYMDGFLDSCAKLNATIIIDANPKSYNNCFGGTCNGSGELIVNYTSNCKVIEDIMATAWNERVKKGEEVVI